VPLFHWLAAPFFLVLGERPDVMFWLRLLMIPLAIVCSLLTGWCAAALYGIRAGWWSALLAAAFPTYFIYIGQFRADVLWTVFCLACFAIYLLWPTTSWKAFVLGLCAGAALTASLKTVLASLAVLTALPALWVVEQTQRRFWPQSIDQSHTGTSLRPAPGSSARFKLAVLPVSLFLFGALLIPMAFLAFFLERGALPSLWYCLFSHNSAGLKLHSAAKLLEPPCWIVLPAAFYAWWELRRQSPRARERALCAFIAAFYCLILTVMLHQVTRQDLLPLIPLLAIWISGMTLELSIRSKDRALLLGHWLLVGFFAIEVVCLGILTVRKTRPDPLSQELLTTVLQLTRRDEYVLDGKGETIFRPRAVFPVFEAFTRRNLSGASEQKVLESLNEKRPMVAVPSHRYPPLMRAFVRSNYLRMGPVCVAGQELSVLPEKGVSFLITLPGRYVLTSSNEIVSGWLDAQPFVGRIELSAGKHVLQTSRPGSIFLVWEKAWQAGFRDYRVP
jgi:hypothetical protein